MYVMIMLLPNRSTT